MSKINWNERREDYALKVVPEAYRQWGWTSLLSVMLGITTAMFFLAWGGNLVQSYGTKDLIIGMILGTIIIGSIAFVFATIATETGLDSSLITSGSGLGYKGAGITSFFYACNGVIFFALEGAIMSDAIHSLLPILPIWLCYISMSLIFIPLTWYGITAMNYIMWITLPISIIFFIWTILLALHLPTQVHFLSFQPTQAVNPAGGPALLQLLATVLGLVGTGTTAADIGRFIPKRQRTIATLFLSYFLNGLTFLGTTILGAWLSLRFKQFNPGLYFPALLGIWGVFFVLITQARINVINAYGTSLAFATFFSRCFGFAPGRHYGLILVTMLGMFLMFGNVLNHIQQVLTFESVFLVAWIMTVISYILFNKSLFKITPKNFQFQRGTIPDYNPIGVISMLFALVVAVPMAFGLFGPLGKTLAPFASAALAFCIVPIATLLFKKKAS